MPKMDGKKFATCVRKTERYWTDLLIRKGGHRKAKAEQDMVPIIAITAHRDQNMDHYNDAGINDVFEKPVGLNEISQILKQHYFK